MSLRTDRVSGTLTSAFGFVMVGFASFALLVLTLQRSMIEVSPSLRNTPNGARIIDAIQAVHSIWSVYLPIAIAGGIVFAIAGLYVRRGSSVARRVAQANAVGGYVWIAAYALSCYRIFDRFPWPDLFPQSVERTFQGVTILSFIVLSAMFPTLLFHILSRPRKQAAGALRVDAAQE